MTENDLFDQLDEIITDYKLHPPTPTVLCNHYIVEEEGMKFCVKCGNVMDQSIPTEHSEDIGDIENATTSRFSGAIHAESVGDYSAGILMYGFDKQKTNLLRECKWDMSRGYRSHITSVYRDLTITYGDIISESILLESLELYRHAIQLKEKRHLNKMALIAAAVYITCKSNEIIKSDVEIYTKMRLTKLKFSAGMKIILQVLHNKQLDSSFTKIIQSVRYDGSQIFDYIERYCSVLDLSSEIQIIIKRMMERIISKKLVIQNNPQNVLLGCIYYILSIANINMDFNKIHTICDTTKVTVCHVHKNIIRLAKYIITETEKDEIKHIIERHNPTYTSDTPKLLELG